MNDELQLTEEDLESMADKLIEAEIVSRKSKHDA